MTESNTKEKIKGYFCRQHSLYLCNHFNISVNGIDYYNSYNIGFEFKRLGVDLRETSFLKFRCIKLELLVILSFATLSIIST